MRTITSETARRIFIVRRRLNDPTPANDAAGILDVVHDLGCLQLDPISAVARSHQLVVWSRVGNYDLGALDQLLWHDRSLFEYWAHMALIVLTEDYPIHHGYMRICALEEVRGKVSVPRRNGSSLYPSCAIGLVASSDELDHEIIRTRHGTWS